MKYAVTRAGNPTTDLLLDNLPIVNTDLVFSEGALLFVLFVIVLLFLKPETISFTLKSIATFIIVRSIFVTMTHLGPFPGHIITDLNSFRYLTSGSDLFFSGHVGMPFLLALLFWRDKRLRIVFIACSIIASVAVILGHLHYTIDVFSAFFIAYGVYHISQHFFKKDHELFLTTH